MSLSANPLVFIPSKADEAWPKFPQLLPLMVKEQDPDGTLSEFLMTHGPMFSATATQEETIQALINLDIVLGSEIGTFNVTPSDCLDVLAALGFQSPDDFGDRKKWLDLYATYSAAKREAAAQKLADLHQWDFSDTTHLIDDVLVGLKPLIKLLKEHTDAIFLMDISGGIDLPTSSKKLFEQRAREHLKTYSPALNKI